MKLTKMGRPKKENAKRIVVRFKVNEEEKAMIERLANNYSLSMSETIMLALHLLDKVGIKKAE